MSSFQFGFLVTPLSPPPPVGHLNMGEENGRQASVTVSID